MCGERQSENSAELRIIASSHCSTSQSVSAHVPSSRIMEKS